MKITFTPNPPVTDRPEDRRNLPLDNPGPSDMMSRNECRQPAHNRSAFMNTFQLTALSLIFSASVLGIHAQDTPSTNTTGMAPRQEPAAAPEPVPLTNTPAATPVQFSRDDDDGLVKLGLNFDHRRSLDGPYDYLSQATFVVETDCSRFTTVGLAIGGGVAQLKSGSLADQIAHQPYYGEIGVFGRRYFTPAHVFLRPYVTASISALAMGWDYRAAIETDNGAVRTDWTYGVDGYVGAGLSAGLRNHWRIFGELGVGGIGLPDTTENNIQNDFLGSLYYVGFKAGLSLTF